MQVKLCLEMVFNLFAFGVGSPCLMAFVAGRSVCLEASSLTCSIFGCLCGSCWRICLLEHVIVYLVFDCWNMYILFCCVCILDDDRMHEPLKLA